MRKRRPASQSSTTKKPRPTSGLNNLRPNLKTHQGRLAPRLLIKTKAHDICIQESRANSWLWFWLIMAGCLLSAGIVYVVSLPDRDAFDFAAFTFILLVIFIAPIFLLLYLPWNRRLKFNPNRSTYQLQKRFYGIVYKKQEWDALHYCLNAELVPHQTRETVGQSSHMSGLAELGVLLILLLLGPLGLLIRLLSRGKAKQFVVVATPGITVIPLDDHAGHQGPPTESILACKSPKDCEEAIKSIEDYIQKVLI